MKKWSILFFLFLFVSCSRLTNYKKELKAHPFNQEVINKLALFDSLRLQILANYNSLYFEDKPDPYFNTNGPKYYYNYMPTSTDLRGLPEQLYQNILPIIDKIGEDLFDGFTILKDSSIVFWISSYKDSENNDLKVKEYLEWDPDSKLTIETYPRKDTILNKNWKLQIWYDQKKSLM